MKLTSNQNMTYDSHKNVTRDRQSHLLTITFFDGHMLLPYVIF